MIQASLHSLQRKAWQSELARAISDPAELFELLSLPADLLPKACAASTGFSLRVPHSYLGRMRPGDIHDPLLRQVLPLGEEMLQHPGFSHDPVGDMQSMTVPGLLHKYHGRALLVATGACGVHCRYCFRRHFPYNEANPATGDWQAALDYLAADSSIREVILSGGDPLSLSDRRLAQLVSQLASMPHIRRLRLHTRLPVVLPARVDEHLCEWLANTHLQTVVVLHINHAREMNTELEGACERLEATGASLLNQSVLLKGVNDKVEDLVDLSEVLFSSGILPYYLHQLDPVQGAAHFAVSDARAVNLLESLRSRLPGYLVPRLVREITAKPAKIPL